MNDVVTELGVVCSNSHSMSETKLHMSVLYLRAVYSQVWERDLLDNLRIVGSGYQSTPGENQEVRPWAKFRQHCAPGVPLERQKERDVGFSDALNPIIEMYAAHMRWT
jgi:hypothetical protein